MSEYRRRCPAASWVVLERLLLIGEAGLHVDSAMRAHLSMVEVEVGQHVGALTSMSAMPCSYLVAWCDAYAWPACRWIPAWIPANHYSIVQAIGRQLLGGARGAGRFCAQGIGKGGGWVGGVGRNPGPPL